MSMVEVVEVDEVDGSSSCLPFSVVEVMEVDEADVFTHQSRSRGRRGSRHFSSCLPFGVVEVEEAETLLPWFRPS